MCGLVGSIHRETQTTDFKKRFSNALRTMSRRGPDGSRIEYFDRVALGHSRLAIIDIGSGNQPMSSADGRYWVIFNGEIYNYRQLRRRLMEEGCDFVTNSDTEVILHCYEKYGAACVELFNGMFSFAIVDRRSQRVFLARDRLGVKPLFYFADGDTFSFASSTTALKIIHQVTGSNINFSSLCDVLQYQASLGMATGYQNIYQFPAGSTAYLSIDQPAGLTIQRYWYPEQISQERQEIDEVRKSFESLVDDATKLRLCSDRPIGAYLSGGVDSAVVAASASRFMSDRLKTFVVGFSDTNLDETARARQVADFLQTDHTEIEISEDEALSDYVDDLLKWVGEPFADPSLIPSAICAREAAKDLTVVLTGDGPDELWGGYKSFDHAKTLSRLDKFKLRRLFKCLRQLEGKFNALAGKPAHFPRTRLDEIITEGGAEVDLLKRMSQQTFRRVVSDRLEYNVQDDRMSCLIGANPRWDQFTRFSFLQMQLYQQAVVIPKVDYATMFSSVEARSPFLDYRVVEATLRMRKELKVGPNGGKHLLKKAFEERLPPNHLHLPKMYFAPPVANWLRGPLKIWMLDNFSSENSKQLLNQKELNGMLHQHFSGYDHSSVLWPLTCVAAFLNRNI